MGFRRRRRGGLWGVQRGDEFVRVGVRGGFFVEETEC
jgi:hypothetical protein